LVIRSPKAPPISRPFPPASLPAHKKASGITGGFLAPTRSLTVFFMFSHLSGHNEKKYGKQSQNDCQNQLHQHINLL
jgi:hypothetical protein